MPAGGMNTQTDTLVGYGMDKANPGGLIEDNDTIGQSVPKPGAFTTLTSTGGYTPAGDITLANGKAIETDTTTGHTATLKAYDVDGAAYKAFLTLTNGNTPSMAIAAPSGGTVTIDGSTIGATTPAAATVTALTQTGAGANVFNSSSLDADFTVKAITSGNAISYDAGTSALAFASTTIGLTGISTLTGAASVTGIFTTGSGRIVTTRVVTAAGAVTAATTDNVIIVNKASGAATVVNLFATPTTGTQLVIKDGKGDAAANNITITPAAGTIDGAATYVLATNYGAVTIVYNGTQWNII